jgi:hypothetical protein
MLHDNAKAAVLAAIRAGHSIRSIDQDLTLGLPDGRTIKLWLAVDARFAENYAKVKQDRGAAGALLKSRAKRIEAVMTPEMRARILDGVNGGKSLTQVLSQKGFACEQSVQKYIERDPEFARLLDEARKRVGHQSRRVPRAESKYQSFFPEVLLRMEAGETVLKICADLHISETYFSAFVKRNNLGTQLELARSKRVGRGVQFTSDQYHQALTSFSEDFSTSAYKFKPAGLPSYNAMVRRCRLFPEFAIEFSAVRSARIIKMCERGTLKAVRPKIAKPVFQTAVLRGQLLKDELYSAANKAVKLAPGDDRDDIIADICEAVLCGELALEEIEGHAGEYVSAHFGRLNSHKFESLDQKLFEDGDMTRGDRLTTDDYSFAE